MASDLNVNHIEGILGIDAIKRENGGRASIFFTLGSQRSWKDKDGEWQNRMTWVPVVYSKSASDNLVAVLTKLTRVRVTGALESYEKETDDGKKNTVVQIRAENIELLPRRVKGGDDGGSGGGGKSASRSSRPQRQTRPTRRRQPEPEYDDEEDDSFWTEDGDE